MAWNVPNILVSMMGKWPEQKSEDINVGRLLRVEVNVKTRYLLGCMVLAD